VDGALDAANSKNVTVTKSSNLGVCLDVTTPQAPRNVVAMIDNGGANPATTRIAGTSGAAVARVCPAGSDAVIATVEEATGFTLRPFYVTFN